MEALWMPLRVLRLNADRLASRGNPNRPAAITAIHDALAAADRPQIAAAIAPMPAAPPTDGADCRA
jgi:hypothetical protein